MKRIKPNIIREALMVGSITIYMYVIIFLG